MPSFSLIGDYLNHKFQLARRVLHSRSGYELRVSARGGKTRTPRPDELLYYEKSPSFCLPNPDLGWAGTSGRECSLYPTISAYGGRSRDTCDALCCQRGYYTRYQTVEVDCNCRYIHCCEVRCERCNTTLPIHFCR